MYDVTCLGDDSSTHPSTYCHLNQGSKSNVNNHRPKIKKNITCNLIKAWQHVLDKQYISVDLKLMDLQKVKKYGNQTMYVKVYERYFKLETNLMQFLNKLCRLDLWKNSIKIFLKKVDKLNDNIQFIN